MNILATKSNNCNHICWYFKADSSFRKQQSSIFKKWCSNCKAYLISKYNTCPCCHEPYGDAEIGI